MKGLERKAIPGCEPVPAGSLAAALAEVPEPRRPYGWRPAYPPLPLVGLLLVPVAACLCGASGPTSVAQWARERLEDAPVGAQGLVPVGLPPGRAPGAATLHRV